MDFGDGSSCQDLCCGVMPRRCLVLFGNSGDNHLLNLRLGDYGNGHPTGHETGGQLRVVPLGSLPLYKLGGDQERSRRLAQITVGAVRCLIDSDQSFRIRHAEAAPRVPE